MSGGPVLGQNPSKMNKRTVNILLFVNISQVGGWKTKPWRATMKRGKDPSPKRKGSHMKWKHRQAQTSVAKHIKAEKLQAKLHFFCLDFGKTRNFPERNWKGLRCIGPDTFVTKEIGIGQAQRKQRLSKEKITNALPLSSSQGLPSFRQVMQLCAALHQVSMGKTPQLFGSILLPTQITGEKSRHWAPLLRTQLIFILLCLSCGVRLTNIPHLSLAKQQVPEKALRVRQHPKRHFQTNIMSSYTNIYLTSTKSSLKSSFLITSI